MQGQAQSEDGENDIPTVIYQDEEVPLTSTSEPTGSNTPPPPPSAPLAPPSCPPPLSEYYNTSDYVKSIRDSTKTKKHKEWLLNRWIRVMQSTQNPPINGMQTTHNPPPPPPCPQPPSSIKPPQWVCNLTGEIRQRFDAEQCFGCGKTGNIYHGCP
jgi:hypothetical protein